MMMMVRVMTLIYSIIVRSGILATAMGSGKRTDRIVTYKKIRSAVKLMIELAAQDWIPELAIRLIILLILVMRIMLISSASWHPWLQTGSSITASLYKTRLLQHLRRSHKLWFMLVYVVIRILSKVTRSSTGWFDRSHIWYRSE